LVSENGRMNSHGQGCKGSGFRSSHEGTWQLRNDLCAEEGPELGQEVAAAESVEVLSNWRREGETFIHLLVLALRSPVPQ
jgi:hypothetical protein